MNIADNPFWGRVDELPAGDFELLRRAVDARACREAVGLATLDEAADAYRPEPACPACGAEGPARVCLVKPLFRK